MQSLLSKYDAAEQAAVEAAQQQTEAAAPVAEEAAPVEETPAQPQQEPLAEMVSPDVANAPASAEETIAFAQTALEGAQTMEEKAAVLQQMYDGLEAESTVVTSRDGVVELMRQAGSSQGAIEEVEAMLQTTAASGQLVEGFFDPTSGLIFMLADQLDTAETANRVQIHEEKHLENRGSGAPSAALRTGVTREEMRVAMQQRKRTTVYNQYSSRALADEVLAVGAEIAEEEGVDAIPERLRELGVVNEDFINFVQNNVDNGRRNGQRRHLERRASLQPSGAEEIGGQDGRDRLAEPGDVGRPRSGFDEGGAEGTRSGEPAGEPAPAGESGAVEEPAAETPAEEEITREITANIGGSMEGKDGNV